MAGDFRESILVLEKIVRDQNGDTCSHLLPLIQCPTLLLFGAKDAIVTTEEQQQICDQLPTAEMCQIAGGGHNINLQYPDVCNRIVAEYLQREIKS